MWWWPQQQCHVWSYSTAPDYPVSPGGAAAGLPLNSGGGALGVACICGRLWVIWLRMGSLLLQEVVNWGPTGGTAVQVCVWVGILEPRRCLLCPWHLCTRGGWRDHVLEHLAPRAPLPPATRRSPPLPTHHDAPRATANTGPTQMIY